jgi:hypothetical protein
MVTGDVLRFKKGPALYGSPGSKMYTNHPVEGQEFNRKNFRPLEWTMPTDENGCKLIMADHYADLPIVASGSFTFYLDVEG